MAYILYRDGINGRTPETSDAKKYVWFSTRETTYLVIARNDIVICAPTVLSKFRGQPVDNLRKWMKRNKRYQELEA